MKEYLQLLKNCPFCKELLVRKNQKTIITFDHKHSNPRHCPNHSLLNDDEDNYAKNDIILWTWSNSDNSNWAVNILKGRYQLHFNLDSDTTKVLFNDNKIIYQNNGIMRFSFNEKSFDNKLKMIIGLS